MSATSLKGAVETLQALARAPEAIAREVAPRFAALIDAGFDAGTDPYGAPWAPLARSTVARGRRPPPLTNTGGMRASARVTAFGPEVVATVEDPADYHQAGTSRMHRRQVLPTDAAGLPRAWAWELELAGASYERRVA